MVETSKKKIRTKTAYNSSLSGTITMLLPKKKPVLKKRPALYVTFSSFGIILPFCPSMWDNKTIEVVWGAAMKIVRQEMEDRYSYNCTEDLLNRLKQVFEQLDYNTYKKAIAITLSQAETKIFYLDFSVEPVAFFADHISILELAANFRTEASFYYLLLTNNNTTLYNYAAGNLHMMYEHEGNFELEEVRKNVINNMRFLNPGYEKPVFITGNPGLTELFLNNTQADERYIPLLYKNAYRDEIEPESDKKNIVADWGYWDGKFVENRIYIAKQAGYFVSYMDKVLAVLKRGQDGLLLISKNFKRQLLPAASKNLFVETSHNLLTEIEFFLNRGNHIKVVDSDLLRNAGGIALIVKKATGAAPFINHNMSTGRELF
jgi:hypothetical protein